MKINLYVDDLRDCPDGFVYLCSIREEAAACLYIWSDIHQE
jgi:hypothetical protein